MAKQQTKRNGVPIQVVGPNAAGHKWPQRALFLPREGEMLVAEDGFFSHVAMIMNGLDALVVLVADNDKAAYEWQRTQPGSTRNNAEHDEQIEAARKAEAFLNTWRGRRAMLRYIQKYFRNPA